MSRPEMGPYVLLHEIGADALSKTYRAGLKSGDDVERVVLLCLFQAGSDDVAWISETATVGSRALQGLRSPHLADLVDSGEIEGTAFLAYDYIPGTTLSRLLNEARKHRMPVPLGLALLISNRCAEGLQAAWRHESRMLHGFLVPSLVLVSNEGEVRVLGFEVASRLRRLLNQDRVRDELAAYLAPEVVPEGQPATTDDVYSLGAILFELLTGAAPPRSEPELALAIETAALADSGELPGEVRELLTTSLVAPPRRSTLQDWAEALREIVLSGRYETSSFDLAFFINRLFGHDLDSADDDVAIDETESAKTRAEALATVRMQLDDEDRAGLSEAAPRGTDAEAAAHRDVAAPSLASAGEAIASGERSSGGASRTVDVRLIEGGLTEDEPASDEDDDGAITAFPHAAVPDAASRKRALAVAASVVALILGGLGAAYYFATDRAAPASTATEGTSLTRAAARPAARTPVAPAREEALESPPGGLESEPATLQIAGASVPAPAGSPSGPEGATTERSAGSASSEDIERRVQELVSKRSASIEATLRDQYAQQIKELQAQLESQREEPQPRQPSGQPTEAAQATRGAAELGGAVQEARQQRPVDAGMAPQGAAPAPLAGATVGAEGPATTPPVGDIQPASTAGSSSAKSVGEGVAQPTTPGEGPTLPQSPAAGTPIADPSAAPTDQASSASSSSASSKRLPTTEATRDEQPVRKGDLVTAGPGVEPPTLKESVQPHFPIIARRLNKQAVITLRVLVDETGRVSDVEQIGDKAGYGFDEEAIRAAKQMTWAPATKDGVPVQMWSTLRLAFKP